MVVKSMIRCTKCILPESYPDIEFDKNGVCNKCREHEENYLNKNYTKLRSRLEEIFDWAKSQKKRYDCLVPFSGGKDSSYTLYICRKVYGLSVLAVNFNNGLRTIAAIENMERIFKELDVGYMCYGPPWELMRKLYREFFLKTGQFCFPCDMGIWATVHRIAEKEDVPLIVSGFSAQIESRGAKIYSYNNNLFKNVVRDLISTSEARDFLSGSNIQKAVKRLKRFRLTRYRRQISLPDYIEWDDKVIKDTITNELGWRKGGSKTGDHIDCLFAPIKNYLVLKKWGFGEKTTKYSSMIRAGQISREAALERVAVEEPEEGPAVLDDFLKKLGLTNDDIESAQNKNHLIFM